jgi:ribonuclease BN (tRNA processing enzyme)
MAEIVILGGGHDPAGCPLGRSYALVVDGAVYLLDCGDSCGARLRPNGIDPISVRAVFITHMHYDHMAGLFGFLFNVWAYCRREEDVPVSIRSYSSWGRLSDEQLPSSLTVAVPREGVDPLEQFLPVQYLARELWRFPLHIVPIRSGLFYEDELVRLSAYPTGHLTSQPLNRLLPAKYPGISLESYGFTVDVGGKRVVYSGDLALAGEAGSDEFRPHVQDADVVITEVAHVPPEYHLTMLSQMPARRIILVHVHEKLEKRVAAYLAAHPDERFTLAQNGMRFLINW